MASEKSTNNSDLSTSDTLNKGTLTSQQPLLPTLPTTVYPNHRELCPSRVDCFKLSGDCLDCELNSSCVYGREYNVTCRPKPDLDCVVSTLVRLFGLHCMNNFVCSVLQVWSYSFIPRDQVGSMFSFPAFQL